MTPTASTPLVSTPLVSTHVMPAEWAPHAATWLAWPHNEDDFPGKLVAVQWAFAELTRRLAPREMVRILVLPGKPGAVARRQLADAGVPLDRVEFIVGATNRSWVRDSLPLFTLPRATRAGTARPRATKFRFNAWARYDDFPKDERAGRLAAKHTSGSDVVLPAYTLPGTTRAQRMVLEGGSIDVDGEGTALLTEECLLGEKYPRNPGLGREGTEAVLREHLGVEHVLWVARGIAGDDTSGHIDDFARFVRPGVVVLCEEKSRRDENHRPLEEARERLAGARDLKRRKLEVVRLPMPSPLGYRGERLPASYANFYIGNGVVLVPTFNDPMDPVALGILAELFPDRQVHGIHCAELVVGLGSIHCSTMQEPLVPKPRRK